MREAPVFLHMYVLWCVHRNTSTPCDVKQCTSMHVHMYTYIRTSLLVIYWFTVLPCILRRIYPRDDGQDYYTKFFEQACPSLCTGTAASRARQEEIK